MARSWRSMTTRSTTQRVAAGLLAGSRANCHEEQLDERYRADNRAQDEHIRTKLAEIDAVIVPRR